MAYAGWTGRWCVCCREDGGEIGRDLFGRREGGGKGGGGGDGGGGGGSSSGADMGDTSFGGAEDYMQMPGEVEA